MFVPVRCSQVCTRGIDSWGEEEGGGGRGGWLVLVTLGTNLSISQGRPGRPDITHTEGFQVTNKGWVGLCLLGN